VAGSIPSAPLDQSGYHDSLTATAAWSSAAVTITTANETVSWAARKRECTCRESASGWVIESQTNPATVCLLDRVVRPPRSYQASVTASTAQNYAMEIVTFKGGFIVAPPPPSASSVNPNSGAQGRVCRASSSPAAISRPGRLAVLVRVITVNSCTFNSALTHANIIIGSTVTLGHPQRHPVTNPDSQSSTLSNAFSVTTPSPFR